MQEWRIFFVANVMQLRAMMDSLKYCKVLLIYWKSLVIVFTPIFFIGLVINGGQVSRCAYLLIVIAIYWVTEALPLSATAFIPVFGFPLLGILDSSEVSAIYMTKTNMLFMGGLIVAVAIEHCNLHRRIALFVILHVGQSTGRLMGGFMITTMLLSMWISNAAATAMMVPIMSAILLELHKSSTVITRKSGSLSKAETSFTNMAYDDADQETGSIKKLTNFDPSSEDMDQNLKDMYFLATAYAANIGGTGSPTGSGANVVTKALFENTFTEETSLTYASWVIFNIPGMLICVSVAWLWLQYFFLGHGFWRADRNLDKEGQATIKKLIKREYKKLGPLTFHEIVIMSLFSVLIALWMLRAPGFMNGWAYYFNQLFGRNVGISDATSAWLIILLMFAIPAKPTFWPLSKLKDPNKLTTSDGCLTWEVVHEKTPWGVVFLLGGGFALAEGSKKSGLSLAVAEHLNYLNVLPAPAIVLVISILTAMITEIASNSATSSVLMPILKDTSMVSCINPLYTIVPATACCCYAFMLPVATPPNALVHSMANMKTTTMIKAGLGINIICVLVINVMINTLGIWMYDIHHMPLWANSTTGDTRCWNASKFAV